MPRNKYEALTVYVPTPQEIELETAKIREGLTDAELQKRAGYLCEPYTLTPMRFAINNRGQ